jgi:hypothetical protein
MQRREMEIASRCFEGHITGASWLAKYIASSTEKRSELADDLLPSTSVHRLRVDVGLS